MTTDKKRLSNDELWDEISHQVAMVSAENWTEPETLEEQLAIEKLDGQFRRLLHKLRQEAFAELVAAKPAPKRIPIPPRLLDMGRDALIARWHQLQAQADAPVVTHYRRFEKMCDDELRVLVWDVELLLEARKRRTRMP